MIQQTSPQPKQTIDRIITSCEHKRIVINGQFPREDNPDGIEEQLYFAYCLNPECPASRGSTLLDTFENYQATERTYNNHVVYERVE